MKEAKVLEQNQGNGQGRGQAVQEAHHPEQTKVDLINRLKRIEGQVRGLARMIETDVYCDDVLNQIISVQAALNGVRMLLLEAHIRSCVVEQIETGRQGVIDELMKTISKMTR